MTDPPASTESIDGVVEVRRFGPQDAPARVLFEVPHGATEDAHFNAAIRRLRSEFPEDLIDFFRVNTDFGAPELARAAAIAVAAGRAGAPGPSAIVVRGLVPRTLVDLNRTLDAADDGGMTPGLPPYVRHPDDHFALTEMWSAYQARATSAYVEVCGHGGVALALHTYAPRSIELDSIDEDVVARLRAAYAPGTLEQWPVRPEADLILPIDGDRATAHPGLVATLRRRLEDAGLEVAASRTYRLVPATLAYRHALDHPASTACLEVRRDLLGRPWRPFEPSIADAFEIARLGRAIADACLDVLDPVIPDVRTRR